MDLFQKRLKSEKGSSLVRQGQELPRDYVKAVSGVLSEHFGEGMKALGKIRKVSGLSVRGQIYFDEIILAVSILFEKGLSASSFYGSVDFDPSASHPKAEDLLKDLVDALGSLMSRFLDGTKGEALQLLADPRFDAATDVPLVWSPMEIGGRKVFLRMDKSNIALDDAAEEWLKKNDPDFSEDDGAEGLDDDAGDSGPHRH